MNKREITKQINDNYFCVFKEKEKLCSKYNSNCIKYKDELIVLYCIVKINSVLMNCVSRRGGG